MSTSPINLGPYILNAPSPAEKGHIRDSLDLGSASLLQGEFLDVNRLRFVDPNNSSRSITLDKTILGASMAERLRFAREINIIGDAATVSPAPLFDGSENIHINILINPGVINEAKLATDAVVGAKIKDGTITPNKLSAGAPNWTGTGSIGIIQPVIELGTGITANSESIIDFHSVPSSDYDARIIRGTGANGSFSIINTGTGNINIGSHFSISGTTATSTRQVIGALEITGNQINTTAASNTEIALNYKNSDSTTATFLNTTVFDGKQNVVAKFSGDTKTLETYGPCRGITSGQVGWATAGLESRSATGNALVSLHAAGNTAALLRHVRQGSGVEVRTADDAAFAPLKASQMWVNDNIIINNGSPTLYLQDTDHRSAMVYVNGNQFYILRGSTTNSTTSQSINNAWPLQIDLETNYAILGGGAKINGTLSVTGDVIAYATSDKNLKTNIKNIDEPLNKLQKINGVTFDWDESKQEIYSGSDIGVIAQEIEQILPDAVCTREDGYKAVKYEKIIPLLIESVKELTALVETLQTKIANLENQ